MGLILEEERSAILKAAIEVHRTLGPGFLEAVYQEALAIEFEQGSIPFQAQCPLRISYKGELLEKRYMADFVCFESVVVEIKAIDRLSARDMAQAINYLKATGYRVCLLLNFGAAGKLQIKPIVL